MAIQSKTFADDLFNQTYQLPFSNEVLYTRDSIFKEKVEYKYSSGKFSGSDLNAFYYRFITDINNKISLAGEELAKEGQSIKEATWIIKIEGTSLKLPIDTTIDKNIYAQLKNEKSQSEVNWLLKHGGKHNTEERTKLIKEFLPHMVTFFEKNTVLGDNIIKVAVDKVQKEVKKHLKTNCLGEGYSIEGKKIEIIALYFFKESKVNTQESEHKTIQDQKEEKIGTVNLYATRFEFKEDAQVQKSQVYKFYSLVDFLDAHKIRAGLPVNTKGIVDYIEKAKEPIHYQ